MRHDSAGAGPNLQPEFDIGAGTNLEGITRATFCYVPGDFPVGYPAGDNCGAYYSSKALNDSEAPSDPQLPGGGISPASAPEPAWVLLLACPAALLIRRHLRSG
jgi:hypothetical protein